VGSKTRRILWTLFAFILPTLIVVFWYIAARMKMVSSLLLPAPRVVTDEFWKQLTVGTIKKDIAISLQRILKGYALASTIGVFLGVIMGMSRKMEKFFSLTFTSLRQIPMMAWVPLLIIWFGIGEESKVAVIFMAAYFPILMNTLSGIRRTDPKLIEVGKMYKLSKLKLFTKIYLPSALPNIFVGLKLGLGISWMAVVGAEMIAASSGIGFRLSDARTLMQFPIVFSGMIAIAITGVFMDMVLTFISRTATPWEKNRH